MPSRLFRRPDAHAADPIQQDLHAGTRQGRYASLRDGLRPPLTPDTTRAGYWVGGSPLSNCPFPAPATVWAALSNKQESPPQHACGQCAQEGQKPAKGLPCVVSEAASITTGPKDMVVEVSRNHLFPRSGDICCSDVARISDVSSHSPKAALASLTGWHDLSSNW